MEKNATVRYKENPFLDIYSIPKKDKRITVMGATDNVLVNQNTGEIKGTQVVTYSQVDSEKFVKLFALNIRLTFDLCQHQFKIDPL